MFKKRNVSGSSAAKKKVIRPLSDSDSESETENQNNVATVVRTGVSKFKRLKPSDSGKPKITKPLGGKTTDAVEEVPKDTEADEGSEEVEKAPETVQTDTDDGLYKGLKSYDTFFDAKKLTNREPRKVGPVKLSASIRSTHVFDFQPDVCKDFKQTGYCGYGDTCKFLHLRDDAKAGAKLDREWESVGKPRGVAETNSDAIPFKCPICKDDYKSPIVTPCHHYFCRKCYLDHYRTDKSCFICHKNTGGSMLIARDLQKLIKQGPDGRT